mmetsp:Transcript_15371/g.34933  ORF Transcript_15371/g.34933 Transcript_15371/m.34933 type:complete len:261 (-) Transcript_15371:300-1082(-)
MPMRMACQTLEFRGCLLGPVSPGCGGGDEHSAKADAKSWAALEAEQKRPCRTPLEAVQMLLHGPPGLPASWVPEALYALENLQRRFMRFCSNRDGSLSMQDFAALMKSYNSCRPEDCEAFFCAFQRGSRDSPAPPAAVDRLDDDADHRLADGRPDYEGVDPDPSEGRLSFRDFARGVCAADPECTLTLTERAKYIFDFFDCRQRGLTDRRFCLQRSLLRTRWPELRGVFLAAHRGAGHFACLHSLYMGHPELFRHCVSFL